MAGSSTTSGATSLGIRRLDHTSSGMLSGGQEMTGEATLASTNADSALLRPAIVTHTIGRSLGLVLRR